MWINFFLAVNIFMFIPSSISFVPTVPLSTHLQNDDTFELSKTFKDQVMRPILKAHFQRDEFLGRYVLHGYLPSFFFPLLICYPK